MFCSGFSVSLYFSINSLESNAGFKMSKSKQKYNSKNSRIATKNKAFNYLMSLTLIAYCNISFFMSLRQNTFYFLATRLPRLLLLILQ